jgi:hypothetical protein
MKNSPLISRPAWWLVLSILSAVSMAYYVVAIWSANQPPHFSDLYAPWWGAHEMLLHGRNPYSPEVAHQIQTVIYGAPAAPSSLDPSGQSGGFAYPPYAALLLWPTVYLPFSVAQKIFLLTSVLITLLSLTLWLRALRLHLPPLHWLIVALFVLGSFPALQAIKLQNLSLPAAALIALTLFSLSANQVTLAGILLAASTFKPQFTIALIPWLLLWSMGDWRRRRSMIWSFLATLLLLALVSAWLVPGWISSFMHVLRAYRHYTYGHSVLDVWFSPSFGPLASAVVLLTTLVLCWPHRGESAGSPRFFLVTSLPMAATVVVIPTLAPHAQLLLLPGCLCLLPTRTPEARSAPLRVLQAATWMLLAWSWIAALGLMLATLWLPAAALIRFWQVPLYTSPLLPLAVSLALGCLLRAHPGMGSGCSSARVPGPAAS